MAKYIDADKLIAEIERLKKEARKNALIAQDNNTPVCALWSGKELICTEILDIITSLQQELPEADLEKEVVKFVQSKEFIESRESPVLLTARHFWNKGYIARNEKK